MPLALLFTTADLRGAHTTDIHVYYFRILSSLFAHLSPTLVMWLKLPPPFRGLVYVLFYFPPALLPLRAPLLYILSGASHGVLMFPILSADLCWIYCLLFAPSSLGDFRSSLLSQAHVARVKLRFPRRLRLCPSVGLAFLPSRCRAWRVSSASSFAASRGRACRAWACAWPWFSLSC